MPPRATVPNARGALERPPGCCPGLTIDSTIGAIDWERAAKAGAKVGRQGEEPETAGDDNPRSCVQAGS